MCVLQGHAAFGEAELGESVIVNFQDFLVGDGMHWVALGGSKYLTLEESVFIALVCHT